jgi:hypothetical protein
MRVVLAAACAALLLAGCSGGHSSATPTPSPTPDPYTALAPPTSRGVGSFDPVTSTRALDAAHGLLAQSLAEVGTLTGSGTASLLDALHVPDDALGVTPLLSPPTRKGLGIRPLLGKGVALDRNPVQVVRSRYQADEVFGLGGEHALRVTWDGSVRYRVRLADVPHQIAYVLHVAYLFAPVPGEPGGLQLMQVLPGTFHAAPVVASCLDKGVLYPAAGAPTAADLGPGPFPAQRGGPACPV